MSDLPTLVGGRVTLRPLEEADLDALVAIAESDAVRPSTTRVAFADT